MPTRLLREGILASDRVNQLDWAEEVFYRRLMSKVDDHGLFDARPSILRSLLYPLKVDRVREADITRWMAACQKAGLIVLYEADGKPYLQMRDTNWQKRGDAKYPIPKGLASDNGCKQELSSVHLGVVEGVVEGVDTRRKRRSLKTPIPENFTISSRVVAWAKERGIRNLAAHFEHFVGVARAKGYAYVDWDQALINAVRNDWAKLGAVADPMQGVE